MSGLGTPARRFRLTGWSDPRPIALVLVIAAFCAVGMAEATGGGPTMPFGAIALRLMSELLLPLAGLGVALGLAAPIEAGAGLLAMAVGAGAGLVWRHDFLELVARLPNAASHAFLAGPIAGLGVGLLLLMPASLRRVLLVPVAALTGAMLLVVVKLLDPSLRDPHVPWLAGLGALALLLALANALRRVRHPVRFTAARILGSWVLAVAFLYGGASVATRGRAAIPSAPTRLAPPPDATLFPEFGHAPVP